MEAATKALLWLCSETVSVASQNLLRASTANFTLFFSSSSASSIDKPLDTNPGILAYKYNRINYEMYCKFWINKAGQMKMYPINNLCARPRNQLKKINDV